MKKSMDVFCEIPCLTEQSVHLNGINLQKKWFRSADKRIIGQYLQKFVDYNSAKFKFLGVQPLISGFDNNTTLSFHTANFIGAIPLRASDTGKQIGDFVVIPRFIGSNRFEDYIDILDLLDTDLSPNVIESLPLVSGRNFKPPLYLEAVKFISSIELLLKSPWRKFDNSEQLSFQPIGQINWTKYINDGFKVENRLKFPTRKNILSEFHTEYSQIRFVFDICKNELQSSNTPIKIKNELKSKLNFIEEKLYFHQPMSTKTITIKFSDTPIIKTCKENANRILKFNFIESTAWRVDFSNVFEKFVQFVFKEVAKEKGGKLFTNFKFHSKSSKHYSWELKHIEPDAIYQKDELLIFIDAKYKANLYNKFEVGENLKEEHRYDIHQIMAYSSFSNTPLKYGFLCYPSNDLEIKKIIFKNGINNITSTIFIFGIPLKRNGIKDARQLLTKVLTEIERI